MERTYLITLRHTDATRFPARPVFIVPSYSESRAIIVATDRYRETFGRPERGASHGCGWVHCDFLIDGSARYVPLNEALDRQLPKEK